MKNSSGNTPAPAWSKLKTNFSIISLHITEQCWCGVIKPIIIDPVTAIIANQLNQCNTWCIWSQLMNGKFNQHSSIVNLYLSLKVLRATNFWPFLVIHTSNTGQWTLNKLLVRLYFVKECLLQCFKQVVLVWQVRKCNCCCHHQCRYDDIVDKMECTIDVDNSELSLFGVILGHYCTTVQSHSDVQVYTTAWLCTLQDLQLWGDLNAVNISHTQSLWFLWLQVKLFCENVEM